MPHNACMCQRSPLYTTPLSCAASEPTSATFLGYRPRDNAEDYADKILAGSDPMDPQNLSDMCQGGPFAVVPLGESGVAMLKQPKE